jgi:type IV secretory pathway TraG/TraD family ATPase VirD4
MDTSKLGTAEWASPSHVVNSYTFKHGDFWLGRAVTNPSVALGFLDDRHVCLVSGGRGGKGTSIIVNNLCLYPGSVVVVDPKGENATITAARRGDGSANCEGMGQRVMVLDPYKAATVEEKYRCTFNPLDALDPNSDQAVDDAALIADALIVSQSSDPYWDESARQMIKGLILHVLTAERFEGRRNLVTVRKLIASGYGDIYRELKDEGEDPPAPQEILWEYVTKNEAFDGILSEIGQTFYGLIKGSSQSHFDSVLSTANRQTEFIDSPEMRRCLESTPADFSLSDLKTSEAGISIYLSLPQRYMNTHYKWLRMMITLVTTEMERINMRPATGHPVLMCLDEFAGLKKMEIIENAVAQIAGFGVKLFFVLQSLEQLKAVYKDNWETFLSNSGLKIFFNIEDQFSREYVSSFVGDTEILVESNSEGGGETEGSSFMGSEGLSYDRFIGLLRKNKRYERSGTNLNKSTNTTWQKTKTPQKRRLITSDEVGRLFGRINDKYHSAYPGLALVLVSGENPFPVQRTNYHQDAHFYRLFSAHPDHDNTTYEILMPEPHRELLEYIGTSTNLDFSINDGIAVNQGSSYMRMGLSENLEQFKAAAKPFIKLGKVINQVLPNDISNHRVENLILESSVEGQLSRIDEMRAVVATERPNVNYEIEKKNETKIEAQTLSQQNQYRWATLLALFCVILSILVVFIGVLNVVLVVTFNYSLWSIPYLGLAAIWDALNLSGPAWCFGGLIYLIAKVVLFFVLLALTELLFKLPRLFFVIAYDLSRNIYTCPLPNPRFDRFDNSLRKFFEHPWSRKIRERKPKFRLLRLLKRAK